ncbi:MAG: MFS transporter, partial [Saprospiraceae bacterium]|nr:MFS transporter [Saprospiraceae bacterium]
MTESINNKKVIKGWAFFDWANSAYALVISTAVFPPYFASVSPENLNVLGYSINTESLYSYSVSAAYLLIAIMSPMLSGIADYGKRRMVFLKFFTILGALSCMSLFFFDGPEDTLFAAIAFILGTIGFGAGIVFYNAYLPEITTEDRFDKVSAYGYAYGYVGSVILLVAILALIQFGPSIGIDSSTLPVRIGFLLVGVWWLGFAQITFARLPSDDKNPFKWSFVTKGIDEVSKVFRAVIKDANIRKFLAAYFFYIAGVNVVIYLASIFAQEELNFTQSELIIIILLLQLVAMLGAYFFAYVSGKIGNKKSLLIQITIWIAICFGAYMTTDKPLFFVICAFVGLVLGGIQALSRSSYSKMINENTADLTSYFSFYDVLTKLAIVAGTFVFGIVN